MWRLLQRNQDRVMVGAATTLVMLALLAQARSGLVVSDSAQEAHFAIDSPGVSTLTSVPREHEFYREKWRQIANDFYKANPVEPETPAAEVITASLSDQNDRPSDIGPKISTVSHTIPAKIEVPAVAITAVAVPRRIGLIGPPAVFAAVAAGLLASLLFSKLWPTRQTDPSSNRGLVVSGKGNDAIRSDLARADLLRIEVPSRWVRIRPTPFEQLRPLVLGAACIAGFAAAWSIVSH